MDLTFRRVENSKNEFSLKGSICHEDFMIHVSNNFLKECDAILDGLENRLTLSGDDE